MGVGFGRYFKIIKILSTFFRSTILISRALRNHNKDPMLAKFPAQQANLIKQTGNKGVCRHFLETFDQTSVFFRRPLPLKIIVNWRQRRFYEDFCVVQPQMDVLKYKQRGTPWVVRGSNPRGRGRVSANHPPRLSQLLKLVPSTGNASELNSIGCVK